MLFRIRKVANDRSLQDQSSKAAASGREIGQEEHVRLSEAEPRHESPSRLENPGGIELPAFADRKLTSRRHKTWLLEELWFLLDGAEVGLENHLYVLLRFHPQRLPASAGHHPPHSRATTTPPLHDQTKQNRTKSGIEHWK